MLHDGGLGARLEGVRQTAFPAILTIVVEGHKNPCTTLGCWAFATETLDLPVVLDLVVLEYGHLDLFALVLDLLGGVVGLLFALLGAAAETEDEMEGGFFLNVIVIEGATVFKLLPRKNETLLVGRDAFLVLYLGLHIIDGVGGLNLEGDCLASESLYEYLHLCLSSTEVESLTELC